MNGLTLYEGPSRLGKDDIVVLATGLTRPSVNRKTGDVVQVYILLQDWHPTYGRRNGRDESICGNCVMRQGSWNQQAECYVKGYMLNQPWTPKGACRLSRIARPSVSVRMETWPQCLSVSHFGRPSCEDTNGWPIPVSGVPPHSSTLRWRVCIAPQNNAPPLR